jgi:hypothetical protein
MVGGLPGSIPISLMRGMNCHARKKPETRFEMRLPMHCCRFLLNLTLFGLLGFAGIGSAKANTVNAILEGELLVITGDNLANAITLTTNSAGDVLVVGRNGTLVNGTPSVRFRRPVLNSVEILMFGGNDNVLINGLTVNNDLFLNLGDGNDTLRSGLVPSSIGANLSVEGASGNEIVRLAGWTIGGDCTVDGQTGTLNCELTGLNVGFAITAIGDEARDVVSLAGCTMGGFSSIETRGANDSVTVTDFIGLGLSVNTDAGLDSVALTRVATLEDIYVNTGVHRDTVNFTDVNSYRNITVSLDGGDDSFGGVNVSAQYDAVFEGGAGIDTFLDGGIIGGTKTDVKEFEIFP